MIVIEEDTHECKTAYAQPQLRGATEEMSEISQLIPPPAYSPASYRPNYNSISTPSLDPPIYPHVPPKTPRRRIIRTVLGIIIFCVLCALLENYLELGLDPFSRHRNGKSEDNAGKSHRDENKDEEQEPISSPGEKTDNRIRTVSCIEGGVGAFEHSEPISEDDVRSVQMEFGLPVTSDLYFHGNNIYTHGTFQIEAVESSSSEVEVDIQLSYPNQIALHRSKVCLFEDSGERGIRITSIDADDLPSADNLLLYEVHVRLPIDKHSTSPLYISRLNVDLMYFAVNIGDLSKYVHFGEVFLMTGNRPILAESLTAHKAQVRTSRAAIEGKYTTSSSLTLLNNKGLVNVDITMTSAGEHSSHGTQLLIATSDSPLNATLALSNPPNVLGGNFTVDAVSTNGVLNLDFLTQPLASRLNLYANADAGLEISLPPQYSGQFGIYSANVRPTLQTTNVDDPAAAGRAGRHRFVDVTKSTGRAIEGGVSWIDKRGRKDGGGGAVRATSNHSAVLSL